MDQNFTIINSADFEKILQRMEGFENALVASRQTSSQKIFSEEEVTKLLTRIRFIYCVFLFFLFNIIFHFYYLTFERETEIYLTYFTGVK
jgi:preprotein translocase subunit SecG